MLIVGAADVFGLVVRMTVSLCLIIECTNETISDLKTRLLVDLKGVLDPTNTSTNQIATFGLSPRFYWLNSYVHPNTSL